MEEFLSICSLKKSFRNVPMNTDIISQLLKAHEQIIRSLREQVEQCTSEFEDDETADFLTALMEQHEKKAWILRSFIQGYLA